MDKRENEIGSPTVSGTHIKIDSDVSANESSLETNNFLNSVYRPNEDKWLYRGMIFGSLSLVLTIVFIIAFLAFYGKDIPDGLIVLPTGILGFISGLFYGKVSAEKAQ